MRVERTWRTFGLTVGLGIVAGVLLARATLLASNSDIAGPGWSLRGNGALIIEFAAGPALLAGGWVWLARGRAAPSILAAVATLLIELGVGFAPILAGPTPGLQPWLLVGFWPAVLALAVGLALAPPRTRSQLVVAVATCLLVVLLTLGLPFLLFVLAPVLLPLILAMPTLARYAPWQRLPTIVALPFALVAGTLGVQALVPPS